MIPAPIALFVYNRLSHTRRTVEALLKNAGAADAALHVFSDGARNEAARRAVAEVRSYIRTVDGFRRVTIVEREKNIGLAKSIIDGVTGLCGENDRVIVVEDDLVTSPHFLEFMNDGLNVYAKDDRVISIHGYSYPVSAALPETFFLRGADCWGWATWKRGWDLFDPDGPRLFRQLKERGLTRRFDLDGSYPYTQMLRNQIAGKNDSWAIRWHASAFLADKLTLYPGRSLVQNIGNDDSGTHSSKSEAYSGKISGSPVTVGRIPVVEDERARQSFAAFSRSTRSLTLPRIFNKAMSVLRRRMA
jgi:hypothetical protein